MKKLVLTLLSILSLTVLGACGAAIEVKNTVTYTAEALDYVGDVQEFVTKIEPSINAVLQDSTQQNIQTLTDLFIEMKSDAVEFNEAIPPSIMADLHQQVIDINVGVIATIDTKLSLIEAGDITVESMSLLELTSEFENITNIIDNIANQN